MSLPVCGKTKIENNPRIMNECKFSIFLLKVTAQTAMCHTNPTFEIPVVIGTYPISNDTYASSNDARNQTTILSTAPPLNEYLNALDTESDSLDLPPYPDTGMWIANCI